MKLFRTKENEYILVAKGKKSVYASNYNYLIQKMREIGIMDSEIEMALTELVQKDHNVAHFGVGLSGCGPMFIFSEKVVA